ncbi:ribonuclease H-like domain-containing protein [Tanacetum coccineum]
MATISNVPQLVDNKGSSYSVVAPHDILESVISCVIAKDTWTDLVYSFEVSLRSGSASLRDLEMPTILRPLTLPTFMKGRRNQKDYKTEYKKLKAKLALLEASPPTSCLKTFQPKKKGLVAETFDWDKEEVSDDKEETQVKVLMALADDELEGNPEPWAHDLDSTRRYCFVGPQDMWDSRRLQLLSDLNEVNIASSNLIQVNTVRARFDTVDCVQSLLILLEEDEDNVYAFMVENPNGSNLLHQDLEQIHEDDLEAIDSKWQLSLLSMRGKYQRIGKKIFINANDTVGYDKSKSGLRPPIEEQLITYRKNEVLFSEEVAVLKREVACKDYEINVLKSEFEKITNKSKKGLGYSAVPPPHPLIYNRPKKLDLSYSSLDEFKEPEFKEPEFKGYGTQDSKKESNVVCDKKSYESKENSNNSLVKEQVSKDTSSFVESSLNIDKESVFPVDKKVESVKPKDHEKPVKKSVRLNAKTIKGKGWFTLKVNTAKAQAVNTVRPQAVNTARPNTLKTARPNSIVINAVRVNQENVVKASACWGKPQQDDTGFVDSGCSRHMTGNIAYLSDFKEFDGGYVTFGGGAHGGRISSKGTLKTDSLDFEDVYFVNELKFNLFSVSQMCDKKNYVLFTDTECLVLSPNFKLPDESQILLKIPRKDNMYSFDMKNIQNGVAERRNRILIEAARTMLADSKLPTTFWAEAVSTACYVQNMVLVVKPHNKTPYELFRGFKPSLSFMRPFRCHVTILNTLDNLGKFDGKSDEENKPMIEGNGPKWLFDIDSLTQSMNYVPVAAGTIINEYAGTQEELNDVDNGEPKSAGDDQKEDGDGPDNKNDEQDKSDDVSSPKEVNAAGQHVNTARPDVNTGSSKLNNVDSSVNTAGLNN